MLQKRITKSSKEGRVAKEGHLVPKEGCLDSKEDRKFQKRVARFKRGSLGSKEGREVQKRVVCTFQKRIVKFHKRVTFT